ncbi:MAG: BrnA antitoxin family protein, partial [Sneathiella sp.]
MVSKRDKKIDPFEVDEDTAPLTDAEVRKLRPATEVFAKHGVKMPPRPRGRPTIENPKRQVNMRLDADLLDKLRERGKGWQTEVNEKLREIFL